MVTETIPATWSPTNCPVSTDVWEVRVATDQLFFLFGPWPASSNDCLPSSYNPTSAYAAYSCPTGYTSACAHGINDATTVCCPNARDFKCTTGPKIYDSSTMSCFETFSQPYTAIVTTTSAFGNATTVPTGTNTVTFTAHSDAINAFQFEYVPMTSTSASSTSSATSSASTTTSSTTSESTNSATSTSAASGGKSGNSLSGGAIAGIVVGAVALVGILLLAWYWIRRKTGPKPSPADDTTSSNYYGAGTSGTEYSGQQSASDYKTGPSFPPAELAANEGVATELSSSQIISEK
ncbi:hypothetical protein N7456_009074 [Penicillium angulare]|uniref:Mid2 domain-containing protein n=1 Tax=Penicillium angulare TaxID=116970 RepID=A0A9W9F3Y1_9EURO|nr:hypothetical protein N7456_009074 [Penicillium angulare]